MQKSAVKCRKIQLNAYLIPKMQIIHKNAENLNAKNLEIFRKC
jgi:hypothetical protein